MLGAGNILGMAKGLDNTVQSSLMVVQATARMGDFTFLMNICWVLGCGSKRGHMNVLVRVGIVI